MLPRCSKRFPQDIGKGRPCLNAHIGKCMAVCSGKISCENYNQAVKNAVHLIRYGKKDILKTLNERMLEASDRLEFETAALLRDQINAITKVTAGQKVVVDPEVEMDVVALAGTPSSVCAAVLRFREGRLTDKREFLFHDTADIAAVREEFLPRYYLDDEQIPKIIAVDELPPDSEVLQQALNEKRGSEVQLYVPQRGDKAHLVEMAHTNAVERLARESGRYAREEKLLDEMAQVLGLSKPPRTIESYDISNWGDGTSVCGMVTFRDGKPYKAGYRKFRMKTVLGTDDYASLAETVSRRAAEYEKYAALAAQGQGSDNYFGQKPDLLLMDGGRGQVSAAKAALAGTSLADVPLYGMVKDDHHRTRAIVDSEGREIAINMNRGTFTFITAIQDETHRFANAYRKQQMRKKSYSSTLTEVPGGIGSRPPGVFRESSVLRGDILTEVLLAQLLQGAVGTQLIDGVVDGFQQGGAVVALAQGDGNVGGILSLGHDLEVGIRMDVQVIVEGDIRIQGRINASGSQQLDGLLQGVDALHGSTQPAPCRWKPDCWQWSCPSGPQRF